MCISTEPAAQTARRSIVAWPQQEPQGSSAPRVADRGGTETEDHLAAIG